MGVKHYAYIVQCADGSFYTGYATDLNRRVLEHNTSAKGAKYTRNRRPVRLMYYEEFETRSKAQSREYVIKQLSRKDKAILITKFNIL